MMREPRECVRGYQGELRVRTSAHSVALAARGLSLWLLFIFAMMLNCINARAQSVDFNPVKEEKDSSEEGAEADEKQSTVFSFGRFEKGFRSLCSELEVDQRRTRIFLLAQSRAKDQNECPSCRALWRSVTTTCRQGKKEDAKAPRSKKKTKKNDAGEGAEPTEVEPTPTPEPTPTAVPAARMPSTVVLDNASLLSTAFYEADPRKGGIFQAISNFTTVLLSQPDLSVAEKDYYGILTTYLLAAWEGREQEAQGHEGFKGSLKKGSKKQELDKIFE